MKKTLIAGAIIALVSTGAMAAKPITDGGGTSGIDAEQDARIDAIEAQIGSIQTELENQAAAIADLQGSSSPSSGGAVTYRYIGTTQEVVTLTNSYRLGEYIASCKSEFGPDATYARSREMAIAIDEGLEVSGAVFFRMSDVAFDGDYMWDQNVGVLTRSGYTTIYYDGSSMGGSGSGSASLACSAPN